MMRPTLNLEAVRGLDYYVLLDNSASMAATDEAPNRLEKARSMVREQIGDLGQGDRMMILTFSNHSEVAAPLTGDKGELLAGLDRIDIQETGTDLSEAVAILKASIAEDEIQRSMIFLYSDGVVQETEDLFPPSVETVYIALGKGGGNAGISRFSLSSSPGEEGRIQVFVEVTRDSDLTGETALSLEWDGNLVDAHRIAWGSEENRTHVFRTHAFNEGLVRVSIDTEDTLAVDNQAAAYLISEQPVEVLVVSNGETSLSRAIRFIPEAVVSIVSPTVYSATHQADVVVFDAWTPPALAEGPKGFFFAGAPPPSDRETGWDGEVEYPVVLDWKRNHAVTRGADYRNLQVAKAAVPALSDRDEVLLEARDAPLLYAREETGRRILVSTFPVFQSNWSRLYSFPITLANAVRWLAGRGNRMEAATVFRTAESISILGLEGREGVAIQGPGKSSWELDLEPVQTSYFSSTYRTGPYTFEFADGAIDRYWLNLLNGSESQIEPRGTLSFGKERIVAQETAQPRNREVWSWVALAAFCLLMGEWWLYTRQSWM
jgi:hypothetical protein